MGTAHLRMQGWDFTSPGWYFLTISTKNMRTEFGTVVNGKTILNEAGKVAERFWQEIPQHFPRAVAEGHLLIISPFTAPPPAQHHDVELT